MKYAVTALLLLSACSHVRPAPAFGFHGRVRPGRRVVCVIDTDMNHDRCEQVHAAVDKIDAAVGFELLRAPEEVSIDFLKTLTPESEIIIVGADEMQAPYLGVTRCAIYEKGPGWLRLELVVINKSIWLDPLANPGMVEQVILHEMVHAVGAGHAEQTGPWPSVMRPVYKPGAPTELTPADVAALRAAYS